MSNMIGNFSAGEVSELTLDELDFITGGVRRADVGNVLMATGAVLIGAGIALAPESAGTSLAASFVGGVAFGVGAAMVIWQ